jgi:hypothetical protein
MPFDKINAIGNNCHLVPTSDGRVLVQSRATGDPMEDGVYSGRGPFTVVRATGQRDRVIFRPVPESEDIPLVPDVGLTDYYFFVWFDFEYKSQVGGIYDTDFTEVNEENTTLYLVDAGFQDSNEGTVFASVEGGDGERWTYHLIKIHLHSVASKKPSGWVAGDPLGPSPWFNNSGSFKVQFDVYRIINLPDFSTTRTLDETVEATVVLNATATNTVPGGFISDPFDLYYDASYGSEAINQTWTFSDDLIISPPSGSRVHFEFENLRFEAV